jgi:hypothetical protein
MARTSLTIDRRAARDILAAADFAKEIEAHLNTLVTIAWAFTKAGDDPNGALMALLREGLRKFLARKGQAAFWIWVRERPDPSHPEHAHIVMHVPTDLRKQLASTVRRLVKHHAGSVRAHAIAITYHSNNDVRYLLKGTSKKMQEELDIKLEWRLPQGTIIGKRVGFSESLGPRARRRHQPVRTCASPEHLQRASALMPIAIPPAHPTEVEPMRTEARLQNTLGSSLGSLLRGMGRSRRSTSPARPQGNIRESGGLPRPSAAFRGLPDGDNDL